MAQTRIFPTIPEIKYGGPDTQNPFEWAVYNPEQKVNGKTMKQTLRFALPAWHCVNQYLADQFGPGTADFPWDGEADIGRKQEMKMRGLFELAVKLGIEFYCFHGRDLFFPDDLNFQRHAQVYSVQSQKLKKLQNEYGVRLGWGTENLFSPKMYADGAFNNRNPKIAARGAAEVKVMMDVSAFLDALSYVFWGGRIGYKNLAVNDMGIEKQVVGGIYQALNEYRKRTHPVLQPLEEPKGREPTIVQYARDVDTTLNFLRQFGLFDDFKLNIEGNHALLAGVTLPHELESARIQGGKIGGIDANSGYALVGWDVDRYPEPHDFSDTVLGWRQVDLQGGLGKAVINFDAKPERTAWSIEEKVIGLIMGMDLWASALLTVEEMKRDIRPNSFEALRAAQYDDYRGTDLGNALLKGTDLDSIMKAVESSPLTASDIASSKYQTVMQAFSRKVLPRHFGRN